MKRTFVNIAEYFAEYSAFKDWQVTQLSCRCFLIKLSIHYIAKRSVKSPNVRAKTNPSRTLVFGRPFGILWMPNVRIDVTALFDITSSTFQVV